MMSLHTNFHQDCTKKNSTAKRYHLETQVRWMVFHAFTRKQNIIYQKVTCKLSLLTYN